MQEIAYILEGEVIVTPKNGGNPVSFLVGDLVTFPAGLYCEVERKEFVIPENVEF